MLQLAGKRNAHLAESAGLDPAAVHHYLNSNESKRRVPKLAPLMSLNAAVGQLIGGTHVRDYLSAVAAQDELIPSPSDSRAFQDVSDEVDFAARYMRDGFAEALYAGIKGERNRRAFVADLTTQFRERYIRRSTGKPAGNRLENLLTIAKRYGFEAADWFKSEDARIYASLNFELESSIQRTLLATGLDVAKRLLCEEQIMAAIRVYETKASEKHMVELYAIVGNLKSESISTASEAAAAARADIYEKLAKGEELL